MFFNKLFPKWFSKTGKDRANKDTQFSPRQKKVVRTHTGSQNVVPVCFAYLRELVILSNGDVTTCCLDAKGTNTLGNINETTLDVLWQQNFLRWHLKNVDANERGTDWDSPLCRMCLDNGYMAAFNAKKTDDLAMIRQFEQLSHPFPTSLVIEPTASCNYSCRGCFSGLRELGRIGFIDMSSFCKNILPAIPKIKQVRLYNYGEPFLHPHIIDIIRDLRTENPTLCLYLSVNGMLLNDAIARALIEHKVNFLTISLHGGHTQEGLIKYAGCGPDIRRIEANIENLVRLKQLAGKKLPWICLKALLFNWNDSEEEMRDFLHFGRALGVDFVCWALNSSDPSLSSQRVAPGTAAYQSLVDSNLLEADFYRFPAWPSGDVIGFDS